VSRPLPFTFTYCGICILLLCSLRDRAFHDTFSIHHIVIGRFFTALAQYFVPSWTQINCLRKADVMRSGRFVSHSFCHFIRSVWVQYYCKSNQPILLKHDVMIGPTSRKNCLGFGFGIRSGYDFRSLFRFPRRCGIGDFRRFISISDTVTGRFSRHLAKWLRNDESTIFWERSGRNPDWNPGSVSVDVRRIGGGLRSLSTVHILNFIPIWMVIVMEIKSTYAVKEMICPLWAH